MSIQAIKMWVIAAAVVLYGFGMYSWGSSNTMTSAALTASTKEVNQITAVVEAKDVVQVEEQRRAEVIEKVDEQNAVVKQDIVVAVSESDDTGKRLFLELETLRKRYSGSQATCDTRIEQQLKAGAEAIDLLTELYEGAERRAAKFAEEADGAYAEGLGCEASYDGVRNK